MSTTLTKEGVLLVKEIVVGSSEKKERDSKGVVLGGSASAPNALDAGNDVVTTSSPADNIVTASSVREANNNHSGSEEGAVADGGKDRGVITRWITSWFTSR